MKNVYIYSYNFHSQGADNLAEALNIPRIRHEGSKFRGSLFKTVINWGCTELTSEVLKCKVINSPQNISLCTNKLNFFKNISHKPEDQRPRTVPWTDRPEVAQAWLKEGHMVVVRKSLTGHSGHGIVIVEPNGKLTEAKLYTKYIKKDAEYRIHFLKDEVIDAQRKIRDPDREPTDWKVRSHDNGFIFAREGLKLPPDAVNQARKAIRCSGLDFGAVDVVTRKDGTAFVLEVNTAPGLEGQTIASYALAFEKLLRS